MAVLLVVGVMKVGVMALAAITAERLGPNPVLVARILGVMVIAAGVS